MTWKRADDDLALSFILGRDGGGLSFAGAVALSFVTCLGMAAVVAAGIVSGDLAFACFVLAAMVFSWWTSPAAASVVGIVAFLFADGFALDAMGTLAWHGEADLVRLMTILALSLTVSVLGSGHRDRSRNDADRAHARSRVAP